MFPAFVSIKQVSIMSTKKRSTPQRVKKKARAKKRPRFVPQDAEILNAPEAAAVLGISERLLLRLAREGAVPAAKLGREWRFLRSALRNHIASGGHEGDLEKVLSKRGVRFTVKKN